MWKSYTALHEYFCEKAIDASCDGKEKSKFAGMVRKLDNSTFVKNLVLMYEALEELPDLSLALQKSDINLPTAHRLVSRQVEVFLARKETDSSFYREACKALKEEKFNEVQLRAECEKKKEIIKLQSYQALADSMAKRLLTGSEKALYKATEVVDANTWPNDLPPEFGENDVRVLSQILSAV